MYRLNVLTPTGATSADISGEKNVAALPAPVQAVDIGVQRVIASELGGVGMVQVGPEADVEADAVVAALRHGCDATG